MNTTLVLAFPILCDSNKKLIKKKISAYSSGE